ncbi:MAG: hypothetical protein LUD29_00655 [Clostridia bacterium]|nr:hypothetical protein [Clostridia bacterium]
MAVSRNGRKAEDVSFVDLHKTEKGRTGAVCGVLLATGFLAPKHSDFGPREFVIPNEEVKRIYSRVILCRL